MRAQRVDEDREGDGDGEYEEIVVVPTLGDRDIESDLHALLNAQPVGSARQDDEEEEGEEGEEEEDGEGDPNTGSSHGDFAYRPPTRLPRMRARARRELEDDMEVDELDEEDEDEDREDRDAEGEDGEDDDDEDDDCISSSSRSTSPQPQISGRRLPRRRLRQPSHQPPGLDRLNSSSIDLRPPTSRLTTTTTTSTPTSTNNKPTTSTTKTRELVYPDNLEIAGMCFDPTGRYVYVGSTESHVEWSLRDVDKRWWADSSWL